MFFLKISGKSMQVDVASGKRAWFSCGLFVALSMHLALCLPVAAQTRSNILDHTHDPRGEPDLTVCSQNLANFGSLKDMARRGGVSKESERAEKIHALIKRFQTVGCNVIAIQEVLGSDELKAKEALQAIIDLLKFRTNKRFTAYVGPSNDKISRVGYIVEEGRLLFEGFTSYVNVELPKILDEQDPRKFARGPLEINFRVEGRGTAPSRKVTLVTFHFKSRAYNSKDGSDLSWETYRMEMSEAVRRVVTQRHEEAIAGNGNILILLGDRNSHFDTASAKILTGELLLQHFQGEAPCRLTKRGVPLCQAGLAMPPAFISVLTSDPQTFRTAGTFRYGNTFSWLDDILLPVSHLPFAYAQEGSEGDYESGTVASEEEASDHALVYVRLNW